MNGRINERLEVGRLAESPAILIAAAGTPPRCRATSGSWVGSGSEQGSHKIATSGLGKPGSVPGAAVSWGTVSVSRTRWSTTALPIEDRIIPSPPAPHAPRIAPAGSGVGYRRANFLTADQSCRVASKCSPKHRARPSSLARLASRYATQVCAHLRAQRTLPIPTWVSTPKRATATSLLGRVVVSNAPDYLRIASARGGL